MKVIIVSGIYPNIVTKPGGVRPYILNLISASIESGIEITLIGISNKKNIASNYPFTFIPIVSGLKVSCYGFIFNLFLKAHTLSIPSYSIIHTQRPDSTLPFVLFYKKNPKICTLHGLVYKGFFLKKTIFISHIYQLIEKFVLKRVDKIIAVNEETKENYLEKYPWLKDKMIVIPVGIDTELFKPMDKHKMQEKYGFKKNEKIIIYVGRLEKEKGLGFLLNSFKEVKKEITDCKLVLVGDGREKKNLENLAKDLELKEVIFMDSLEHDKIPEIMNCADVFALSSLYESGPLVVQEALACGIPVVTTNVGRVQEFIKSDAIGRIVERNEKDFARAIIEIFKMDQEKTIKACRQVAMDFSFEKTAKKIIEVYKNLLVNKNAIFEKE